MKLHKILLTALLVFSAGFNSTYLHSAGQHTAVSDVNREFQYEMVRLGCIVYDTLQLKTASSTLQHYKISESDLNKLEAVDTFFYKNNAYESMFHAFNTSPQEGMQLGVDLCTEVASVFGITVDPIDASEVGEDTISWIKSTIDKVKHACSAITPTPIDEEEGWYDRIMRSIVYNDKTKYIPLSTSRNAFYSIIGFGRSLGFFNIMLENNKDKPYENLTKAAVGAIGLAVVDGAISELISQQNKFTAEEEKKKEERKCHAKTDKDSIEDLVAFWGTGPGFKKIEKIQNSAIMPELTFNVDWLRLPLRFSGARRALIMYGEPGNGKGTVVKALSEESGAPIVTVSAEDFDQYKGFKEKIKNTIKVASNMRSKSCIILFDEIDKIIGDRGASQSVLQELHTFLDDGVTRENPHIRILTVFTTNYINKLPESLLRPGRVQSRLYIGPPDRDARYHMIDMEGRSLLPDLSQALVSKLESLTEGLSRAAIKEMISAAYHHSICMGKEFNEDSFVQEINKMKDFTKHHTKELEQII